MSTTTSTTSRWPGIAETVLILVAPLVYSLMGHQISSDGYFRLETTRYLALGQVIDQPFPMLMSIAALPLYHFGDIVATFNAFAFFISLAVIAALLWKHVPLVILRRFMLALIAGSMFAHHTQVFFGELLTAMLVAAGIAALVAGLPLLGYASLVCGVINQPATLPALFLMLVVRERSLGGLLRAAVPAAICVALMMVEFYLRRGNPFANGYIGDHGDKSIMPYSGLPGFSYPIVFGLLSILFSFGKGLALYMPGLWLMFRRAATPPPDAVRQFQTLAAWFVAGVVLAYAKWWSWQGGWFWGPRFFLFASVPAAMALAIHLSDRHSTPAAKALTLAVLGWSVWVGIDGAVYGLKEMAMCEDANLEPLCLYTPEFSALFRPFVVSTPLSLNDRIISGYFATVGLVLGAPLAVALGTTARDLVRRT